MLDNYQELSSEHVLHTLMALAIDEVRSGITLVIVSRESMPDAYIRARVNKLFVSIDWESLRLTAEEAKSIALVQRRLTEQECAEMYRLTDGWVGGLVLALVQGHSDARIDDGSREAIFKYFASEILRRATAETRAFLLQTACLPYVGVGTARRLTGNPRAEQVLQDLYRRNLFTDRRRGEPPSYHYHALFREFLVEQARDDLPASRQLELQTEAAQLLAEAGDVEAAVDLFCAARQWDRMSDLIVSRAPHLLAAGRWQTLDGWLAQIPVDEFRDQPWLGYWRGMSRVTLDPTAAQSDLDIAYVRFAAMNDKYGRLLCACAMAQAIYMESANFAKLDMWLPVLEDLLAVPPEFTDPSIELLTWSGFLIAVTFRRPGNPLAHHAAERILRLLQEPIDANQRLTAGGALILFCGYTGWLDAGNRLVAIVRSVLDAPEVTPLNQAVWHAYAGYWGLVSRQLSWGLGELARAMVIAQEQNFPFVLTVAYSLQSALLRDLDPPGSRAAIAKAETLVANSRPYDVAHYLGNMVYRTCDDGEFEATVRYGRRTFEYLEGTGTLFQVLIWYMPYGWALTELGRLDEATDALSRSQALIQQTGASCYAALQALFSANLARRRGDESSYRALLREGLGRAARDAAEFSLALWIPPRGGASRLLADALRLSIEVETVRRMIRDARFAPPDLAPEQWPWPVKVRCLGQFDIFVEDRLLDYGNKPPRKLLALLKAIIALGSRDVPEHKLIDALWPEEDGDTAHQSFTTALHRLRKLLGDNSLIRQREGRISLDSSRVWVDALAFEALGSHEADADQSVVIKAIGLYRGEFLPNEDSPWAFSMREKLRGRYLELVSSTARRLEQEGRLEEALDLYRRGIEADELAETFHQGLMRCHHQIGRTPEALDAYRRMRELLSRVHGVQPSAATEELYRKLSSR